MTTHCFADKNDCEIVREHPDGLDEVVVLDLRGEVVFSVSPEWTDHQIWTALEVVNDAYSKGVRVGEAQKAAEIRTAIDAAANVPALGSRP